MSQQLNFQKKRIVEYACTGYFSGYDGPEHLHNLLDTLDVAYTTKDEWASEYDDEFEIEKKSLKKAVNTLKRIDKGVRVRTVDIEDLTEMLDDASMTLNELVDCFNDMLKNAEKSREWIYVAFF